jgi:hypothetical protein
MIVGFTSIGRNCPTAIPRAGRNEHFRLFWKSIKGRMILYFVEVRADEDITPDRQAGKGCAIRINYNIRGI